MMLQAAQRIGKKGIGKKGWRLSAVALLALQMMLPAVARADAPIEIVDVSTHLEDGVWYLDADIDYRLNETALEALDNGLELDIELVIQLTERRRLLWDPEFAELLQRYGLRYHALTERYILRNLNSGEQVSYGALQPALEALGTVRRLPVIDDALLSEEERYDVGLRAIIDIKKLGGALALFRLFWNDWRIAGDWARWPLDR
ncbi:MAG TPA: DUF4390 domain-containing protein [Gammaproteobacteria bacterium]|nr:DUF4390 domain-containing protein [Gammaproteobacteria bacterium]